MLALTTLPPHADVGVSARPTEGLPHAAAVAPLSFENVYEQYFEFVWRSARRLGVYESAVGDVVQETFLVVHRKLGEFEGRSSVNTWLFSIVRHVARDHRRQVRRKSPHSLQTDGPTDPETLMARPEQGPHERAVKTQAVEALHAILDELDDEKREVFILAELEQMTAPEMADALGVNLNTIYSRLRSARLEFEQAVERRRARDGWRLR